MKVVLQRVRRASVTVEGKVTGNIDKGYVVLLGVGKGDSRTKVEKMVDKIKKLRLFSDEEGKTNLSAGDVGGGILVVSQFTLYADCRKGARPSFTDAGESALAEELYEYFIAYARERFDKVGHGIFGASMDVELVNEGPFTIILDD